MSEHSRAPVSLYVPASRSDRIIKALNSSATRVIIDLEDAVPARSKAKARKDLVSLLLDTEARHADVRINPVESVAGQEDVKILEEVSGRFHGLVVPKIQAAGEAERLKNAFPGCTIEGIVETPAGVTNIAEICADSALDSVTLGEEDLRRSLMVGADDALDPIRSLLVVAHQAAGKGAPRAGAYANVRDEEGLLHSCVRLRDRGFYGRSAIHPRQIPIIERGFEPSLDQVKKAKALGEAGFDTSGAFATNDGDLVDQPTVDWARTILSRSGTLTS